MAKQEIVSDKLRTPPGVFSHATMIEAQGRLVFISGMTARRGGKIVNLASQAGRRGEAPVLAYCASKAGLAAAAAAVAAEVRRDGVRVIDLRPPHTETGLSGRPLAGEAPRMPRGLDPDDVAARIVQAIVDGESVVGPAEFG